MWPEHAILRREILESSSILPGIQRLIFGTSWSLLWEEGPLSTFLTCALSAGRALALLMAAAPGESNRIRHGLGNTQCQPGVVATELPSAAPRLTNNLCCADDQITKDAHGSTRAIQNLPEPRSGSCLAALATPLWHPSVQFFLRPFLGFSIFFDFLCDVEFLLQRGSTQVPQAVSSELLQLRLHPSDPYHWQSV